MSTNTLTWIGRRAKDRLTVDVRSVVLLHSRDEREADRITVVFDRGAHQCRMVLARGEDRNFRGTCTQFAGDAQEPVREQPVSGVLCDSLGTHAVVLGASAWADEDGEEFDWMGRFEAVQRVIDRGSGRSA